MSAQGLGPGALSASSQPHPSDYDPNNTTLFIGGLSSGVRTLHLLAQQMLGDRTRNRHGACCAGVSEDDLRMLFGRFGDIVYTKIPPGKGCGFVQFVQRSAAETAMGQMQVCPASARATPTTHVQGS